MKINKLALAAGITLALGSAQAAAILPGGEISFEDDNVEFLRAASTEDGIGDVLSAGDSLGVVGHEIWATVTFQRSLLGGITEVQDFDVGSDELTGVSAIRITGISPDGNTFTFGPSPFFESTYGTGAMAALFTESVGDLDIPTCTLDGTCEAKATNGDHWATVGIGDGDDFWTAVGVLPGALGGVTVGQLSALGDTTKVAVAHFGLSVLENNTGATITPMFNALTGGTDDVIGSGDILGGAGLGLPYVARSDFDARISTVPVPAPLALVGLGLLGMGIGRKRKA